MDMISTFVREQARYTKSSLIDIFKLTSTESNGFIRNLKAFGILKVVKNSPEQKNLSELIDTDIETVDEEYYGDNYLYVFTFVGVVTFGRRIIKCYPKYILTNEQPLEEMKQVLKLIERYGKKQQTINMYNGDDEVSSFNMLAVVLFLLNDYHDYGTYENSEEIMEVNGEGEILWDRTIDQGFSIINNNRPYHIELFTKRTVDDDTDFFKLLHKCILTECSRRLEESDILDLFDMVPVHLSEELLSDFGEDDHILYRLRSELSIQFNTRKQILLKTLYAYVANSSTLEKDFGISMFGSNSFNLIWEDVCSQVLGNVLQIAPRRLTLPVSLNEKYLLYDKLIDVICRPVWWGLKEDGSKFDKAAKDTLIPDLVVINEKDGNWRFIIMDAKYYKIQLQEDKQLVGLPGVESITKQYLYQLAFKDFIESHKFNSVTNIFLMPTEKESFGKIGFVNMEILKSLGLGDIQVMLLPARIMYEYYLSKKRLEMSVLDL